MTGGREHHPEMKFKGIKTRYKALIFLHINATVMQLRMQQELRMKRTPNLQAKSHKCGKVLQKNAK